MLFPLQGCGPGSSSERTRTAITAALSKKLKDLMGDFQNLRARLQQEYRWAALLCAALRLSLMVWASSRGPQVRKAAGLGCDTRGLTRGHVCCASPDGVGCSDLQAQKSLFTCWSCLQKEHGVVDPAGLGAFTCKLMYFLTFNFV